MSKASLSTYQTQDSERCCDEKYFIPDEPLMVVLPVDATSHSIYCLEFYIRYFHKIGNKVHVIYVSDEFVKNPNYNIEDLVKKSKDKDDSYGGYPVEQKDSENKETGGGDENKKQSVTCCKKFASLLTSKVVVEVGPSPGVLKELERADRRKCSSFKHKVKQYFQTNGIMFEFHRIISNDVAKAIIRFTKLIEADMVIMGGREHGVLKRIGSVTSKVLRQCHVPVVMCNVVHKPLPEHKTTLVH